MYTSYFGLREAPFNVTPNVRFFYTNPTYHEALAVLHYGIEAKKGFMLITGEPGTGKTTVLRKLVRSLEASIHPVVFFNTRISFIELLRTILHDLGLEKQKTATSTMLEHLNGYLVEQAKQGRIVSLLIDEAQNLSDQTLEGLRVLSNLETETEKLLQIVLIGQPELERKLDRPQSLQLKQRVVLQCRLVPLHSREVSPYIQLRLQAAGYEGAELFHPDAIEQIAFYSRGIPRLINIICDNALLIAYATSQRQVSTEMVREVARDIRLGLETEGVERDGPCPSLSEETIPRPMQKQQNQATEEKPLPPQPPVHVEVPTDRITFGDKDETFATVPAEVPRHEPRHPARFGVWITLLLFVLGSATAVAYTVHSKNRLSALSFKVEDQLTEARPEFFKDAPYKSPSGGSSAQSSKPKKSPMQAKSKPVAPPELARDIRFVSTTFEKWFGSPISRPDEPDKSQKETASRTFSDEEHPPWNAHKESLVMGQHTDSGEIVSMTFPAKTDRERKRYRVKEGDHLYSILRNQFGIESNDEMHDALNRIKELNLRKKNWDVLFVGEVLVLPGQLASFRQFR